MTAQQTDDENKKVLHTPYKIQNGFLSFYCRFVFTAGCTVVVVLRGLFVYRNAGVIL